MLTFLSPPPRKPFEFCLEMWNVLLVKIPSKALVFGLVARCIIRELQSWNPVVYTDWRPSVALETTRRDSGYQQQGDCLSAHPLALTGLQSLYLDGVLLYSYSMETRYAYASHFMFTFLCSPLIFFLYPDNYISLPSFRRWLSLNSTDQSHTQENAETLVLLQ